MDDLKRHDESRNKIGAEALKSCGAAPKNIGIGGYPDIRAAPGEGILNAPTATDPKNITIGRGAVRQPTTNNKEKI